MTTDTDLRIVKLAEREEFEQALGRFGYGYLRDLPTNVHMPLIFSSGFSLATLRAIAAGIRPMTDLQVPTGPSDVADALDALATETEGRAPRDWDLARVTVDDAAVIWLWIDLCTRRSPLLEPLADALRELRGSSGASVVHARRALSMLADADLLLPRVDAALRPIVAVYAGTEEQR